MASRRGGPFCTGILEAAFFRNSRGFFLSLIHICSGEYAVLNGTLNKRWGRENIVDTDVVVNRLMRECTYRNKRSILKKWADHAHEAVDWFIDAYPDLTVCDTTRQEVTPEQFDKGILVPLAWPQPEHYDMQQEKPSCRRKSTTSKAATQGMTSIAMTLA